MELVPIVVDFPLRGEWAALHTPADCIPSHGTDQLAQRYAYDFLHIDRAHAGWKFHTMSKPRYSFRGVALDDCPRIYLSNSTLSEHNSPAQ